jgi:hypothetical protein
MEPRAFFEKPTATSRENRLEPDPLLQISNPPCMETVIPIAGSADPITVNKDFRNNFARLCI